MVSMFAVSSAGAQAPANVTGGADAPESAAEGAEGVPARSTPPFVYGVDAGVAETDNVRLTENDKVSQTIAVVDADFALKEQSRLLEADAKGDFSYLDYLQNAYGGQFIGRFDGQLHAILIPGKLTWFAEDNFGQAALDPFTPLTPTNLENINVFSTGPNLTLNLGPTAFFDLSALYARTQYQTSPLNSNRFQGNIAFGRYLSASSSVSLNADAQRVLFENTALNEDFLHSDLFARYTFKGSRTNLTFDAGASRVSSNSGATEVSGIPGVAEVRYGGNESTTGGLARLTLSRKLSAAATLSISAAHTVTDAGTSFTTLQSGAIGVVGAAPATVTSGSYTSNNVSTSYAYVRGRTAIAVSGGYEGDAYIAAPEFDVRRGGGEFRVERQLSRSFTADLTGRFYKTDYTHQSTATVVGSPNYDDELIAASLAWRYGRGLEIRLRAEHDARVTTGNDTGYKDNRAALTIGYRPYSTRTSMLSPAGY
jgi:hypothetical protein